LQDEQGYNWSILVDRIPSLGYPKGYFEVPSHVSSMAAMNAAPPGRWAFLYPWCRVLREKLGLIRGAAENAARWEYNWVEVWLPHASEQTDILTLRRIREALGLLARVAIVDNARSWCSSAEFQEMKTTRRSTMTCTRGSASSSTRSSWRMARCRPLSCASSSSRQQIVYSNDIDFS
jgi:hypothetical protein